MKLQKLFAIPFLVAILVAVACQAQSSDPANAVTDQEAIVYAAILGQYPGLGANSTPLIANDTSTFACNNTSCNGFLMSGCNGLRMSGETESERMAFVKRDLPELDESTITNFITDNQQCTSLPAKIRTSTQYHFLKDTDITKSWQYSQLICFSRVAFNSNHTIALVYLGLVSKTNAKDSKGMYLLLKQSTGHWALSGSSAVWELAPHQ